MKKVFLIFSIISCVMTTFAQSSFYVYKTDGSTTEYLINDVDSISFVAPTTGIENGYEWVDLGLPSGLKWATCNVGATIPEGYGDYFAWGEIEEEVEYKWGGSWRIPTYAEQEELRENCTMTTYYLNGVKGYEVTSNINGNSIFLPLAGRRVDNTLIMETTYGYYWSSTINSIYSDQAEYLQIGQAIVSKGSTKFSEELTVRAVCP